MRTPVEATTTLIAHVIRSRPVARKPFSSMRPPTATTDTTPTTGATERQAAAVASSAAVEEARRAPTTRAATTTTGQSHRRTTERFAAAASACIGRHGDGNLTLSHLGHSIRTRHRWEARSRGEHMGAADRSAMEDHQPRLVMADHHPRSPLQLCHHRLWDNRRTMSGQTQHPVRHRKGHRRHPDHKALLATRFSDEPMENHTSQTSHK